MVKKASLLLLLVVAASAGGFYFLANRQVQAQVDMMIVQALESGAYEEITYESAGMDLDGTIRVRDIRVRDAGQMEYRVEEVLVSDYDLEHEIPHRVNLRASGFRFPDEIPNIDPASAPALYDYLDSLRQGDTLPLVIDYRYDYAPEEDYLLQSDMGFSLENAASGSFTSTVRKVPLEQFFIGGTDPALAQMQLLSALSTAEIPNADASITDRGIVQAMVDINAAEAKLSPEAFRARLISQAENLHLFAPPALGDFARATGAELGAFLAGGRTLEVSLAPEYGGNMQQLQTELFGAFFSQDYARMLELLNLRIDTL